MPIRHRRATSTRDGLEEAFLSRLLALLPVALVALGACSCASGTRQRRPYLLMENLDNAARHLEAGNTEEAAQIYQTVLLVDAHNEEARDALRQIGEYDRSLVKPTMLGTNLVRAPKRKSSLLRYLAYPLNRLLDLLDVVSLHVGLEGGLYAGAHVTRAAQLSLGAGGGTQLGWWQKRELGVGAGHVAGLALMPFSVEGEGCTRVGTRGASSRSLSAVGLNRPSQPVHQHHRDFWGIGARVIALVVGAEVEFHPVELADAVCGLFLVDFLRDDIGVTRALELTRADRDAMAELVETLTPSEMRRRLAGRAIPADAEAPEKEPDEGAIAETVQSPAGKAVSTP